MALSTGSEVSLPLVGDWAKLSGKQIPELPKNFEGDFLTMYNKSIIIGGRKRNTYTSKCFELFHGTWKKHSTLNKERPGATVVTTDMGIFAFGGKFGRSKDYEYLPNESTSWKVGKSEIPFRIINDRCYAISIPSDEHIWLIGASSNYSMRLILKFNINTHTFQELHIATNEPRIHKRCIIIPGTKKILITGDIKSSIYKAYKTTEILDTENETISEGPSLNIARGNHGIGIVTIKGENKLVVFGGYGKERTNLNGGELYNTQIGKWETVDIKMREGKYNFGFISFKLGDVIKSSKKIIQNFHRKRSPNYIYK